MDKLEEIGFYTLSDERVKNTSSQSQMKRAEMIITQYCNFKCSYCRPLMDITFGDRDIKQMSLTEIKNTIDLWCKNEPLENIRFSGGEPTLHHDIKEIVSYAKSKGIKRIALSTNGSNKLSLYKELIELGVNDFSISLDGACAEDVTLMSGGVKNAFDIITNNIRELSKLTYITVGIVLTPDNVDKAINTIYFADELGVSDIRVIPSAQFNKPVEALGLLDNSILDRHPILKFRVNQFKNGYHVRGMLPNDSSRCALVLDDSMVAGTHHWPCVIYYREHGSPIGKVGNDMRNERAEWMKNHDCHSDPICTSMCLDVCRQHNNKYAEYHGQSNKNTVPHKIHLPIIL